MLCWTWGSTWVAIKFGLTGVPPFIGASIRMLGSGLILLALAAALRMKYPSGRAYLAQIAIQGIGQFGVNFALVYWAEQFVPSGLAAVVFSVSPLVTAVVAALLVPGERLNLANVVGLMLGFAGVAVIYWTEVVKVAHTPPLGILAILGASISVSVSSVIAKRWGSGISPLAMAGPGQLFGGVVLAVIASLTEWGRLPVLNATAVIATIYLATVGSLAFLAYFYLMRSIPVTRLVLVTYVTPVVAVVLGGLLLAEQLASRTFFGALLIFAGVALMYRRTQVVGPEAVRPVPAAAARATAECP